MEYRRNRRNQDAGRGRSTPGIGKEPDWLDEESEDSRNRDGKGLEDSGGEAAGRRRKPGPVMIALLVVLLLAGCTLTLLILQVTGSSRQQEEQRVKEEQMARQLEEIQIYLSSMDETLAGGQISADDGSYERLTAEVGTLQKNLTEYRDNNVIQDDSIGEDLDGVIAQLDSIQENLEEEREAARKRGEDGTSGNQQAARELQSNVDSQLSSVREDIRKLIQEASGENKAEYKELLNVLNGTDMELDTLEKEIASAQEKMQSAMKQGFTSIDGSVSGLKGSVGGVKETLESVKSQQAELKAQLDTLKAAAETQQKEQKSALDTLASGLSDQERRTLEQVKGTEESLGKKLEDTSGALRDQLKENTGELREQLSESEGRQKDGLDQLKDLAEDNRMAEESRKDLLAGVEKIQKSQEESSRALALVQEKLEKLTGKTPGEEPAGHLHIDWDGNEVTAEMARREGGCFHTPVYQLNESGEPAEDENGEKIITGYKASCRYVQ